MRNTLITPILVLALGFSAAPVMAEQVDFQGHTLEIDTTKGPRLITKMISPTYQAPGSARDIILRAQTCVAKHLSNNKVANIPGGPVIEVSQPENGFLVANSRVPYRSLVLVQMSVKSRFTIEAREGRFRITQTDLQYIVDNPSEENRFLDLYQHALIG